MVSKNNVMILNKELIDSIFMFVLGIVKLLGVAVVDSGLMSTASYLDI